MSKVFEILSSFLTPLSLQFSVVCAIPSIQLFLLSTFFKGSHFLGSTKSRSLFFLRFSSWYTGCWIGTILADLFSLEEFLESPSAFWIELVLCVLRPDSLLWSESWFLFVFKSFELFKTLLLDVEFKSDEIEGIKKKWLIGKLYLKFSDRYST